MIHQAMGLDGYNSRSCGTPEKPFPTSQHYHKWLGLSENAPFQTIVYQCIIMFPSYFSVKLTVFLCLKSLKILLKSPSSNSSTRILNIIFHHFPIAWKVNGCGSSATTCTRGVRNASAAAVPTWAPTSSSRSPGSSNEDLPGAKE